MAENKLTYKASAKALKYIKDFEGLRLAPYLDVVNVPTIGWGTTKYPPTYRKGAAVTMKDPRITSAQADAFLKYEVDAKAYVVAESLLHNKISLNQNQFDALVSFAYNVGVGGLLGSTLYKLIKANPNDPEIANQFARWDKGTKGDKKVVIPALTKRRKKESDLYFSKTI